MKFEVKDSVDYKVNEFSLISDERDNKITARTRIAYGLLLFCGFFVVASSAYSAFVGDFSGLKEVVLYVQSPVSFILGYYFREKNEKK